MASSARIDELLQKFGENPRRYFAPLANEYRKLGDVDQAIALCREHLADQPGHMSGHIVYGQALFEKGELVEAQRVFETALALDPENLIALRHLGDISRAYGDPERAREWYQRVLEADPRNEEILAQIEALAAVSSIDVPAIGPPSSGAFASVAFESAGADEPAQSDDTTAAAAADYVPTAEGEPWSAEPERASSSEAPTEHAAAARADEAGEAPADAAAPDGSDDEFRIELEEPALAAPDDHSASGAGADVPGLTTSYPEHHGGFDGSAFAGMTADESPDAERNDAWLRGDEPAEEGAATLQFDEAVQADEPDVFTMDTLELVVPGELVVPAEPVAQESGAAESAEADNAGPRGDELPATSGAEVHAAHGMVEETPEAFVTETMAELYLQQGFRDAALDVYHKLLVQQPHDDALRVRVARLEAERDSAAEAASSRAAVEELADARRPSDRTHDGPTIRELFALVASRRVSARPSRERQGTEHAHFAGASAGAGETMVPLVIPAAAGDEPPVGLDLAPEPDGEDVGDPHRDLSPGWRSEQSPADAADAYDGQADAGAGDRSGSPGTTGAATPASLDELFGRAPAAADEQGTSALSNVYAEAAQPGSPPEQAPPAPDGPTLDQFFRETPRTAEAARRASSFSFDEFFAAPPSPPPAPPEPEQSEAAAEPAAPADDSAARDIEQFNAWLEGLKQK